jgi:hypothetical protein
LNSALALTDWFSLALAITGSDWTLCSGLKSAFGASRCAIDLAGTSLGGEGLFTAAATACTQNGKISINDFLLKHFLPNGNAVILFYQAIFHQNTQVILKV